MHTHVYLCCSSLHSSHKDGASRRSVSNEILEAQSTRWACILVNSCVVDEFTDIGITEVLAPGSGTFNAERGGRDDKDELHEDAIVLSSAAPAAPPATPHNKSDRAGSVSSSALPPPPPPLSTAAATAPYYAGAVAPKASRFPKVASLRTVTDSRN